MNTTATDQAPTSSPSYDSQGQRRPLSRPVHDRMLAGVAAGIARSLGVDPAIVRIGLVVLAFIGGIGVPLYLAAWLLIPEEGRDRSIVDDFVGDVHEWRN